MAQQKESTVKTPTKQRVIGKPFVKDDPRINRDGRPEGTKQFSTLMDEAVKEIAKANKLTEGEVWQVLIKRGYSEAKDGNYMFYKDILDRYFGKALDKFEHSGDLTIQIAEAIAKKNDTNPQPELNSE